MIRIVVASLFSLVLVGNAEAASIRLSWEGGPVAHPAYSRASAEGAIATVVVTATGFDQPVLAIGVRIEVRSQYSGMPDVWRFEPGGCADGGFSTPKVALDPSCPFLAGTNPRDVATVQYKNGHEVFLFAFAHDPVTVPAAGRYTIAQFQFDMSAAFAGLGLKPDSCGCLDQPQAVHVVEASWLGADGFEHPFDRGNECLGWEDPANTVGCPFVTCDIICDPFPPPPPHNPCADQQPTAAILRSWGSVKASYR